MTDLSFTDPCILFALRRESDAFRREFRVTQRFPGAPCPAWFCSPCDLPELSVLVVETGVGAACARIALQWVLSYPLLENVPYQPKLVLSAGFCGALRPERQVGDVVLAAEIMSAAGEVWPATWPGALPPGDWQPPMHRGRVLSMDRLIGSAEEKRALGQQHQAVAVDMESAVLVELCSRASIPFGCLRAVSDDAETSLSPKLLPLLAGGRVSWLRLLSTLLRAPNLAPEVRRLAKQTRHASEQLGRALGELLTLTLSWSE